MFILEIIALIFLCKRNGALAIRKGLKAGSWKWYTVIAWLVGEMTGVLLGMGFYRQEDSIRENIVGISMLGLTCAFGGYLFIKFLLDKKPDALDEEINRIGTDDLHPPRQ
ncbi:MAG: hypothetical protein ABIQ31_26900 [Ferruginibacter sp.]